ncbi:hypothetical protein BOTU111921_13600 [Bordetella tumbae]
MAVTYHAVADKENILKFTALARASIAASALFCGAQLASACEIHAKAPFVVHQAVSNYGGWPISEKTCEALKAHGLSINISGDATVMRDRAVAWAVVSVIDSNTNITSSEQTSATLIDSEQVSQALADKLLVAAIESAAHDFDLAKAIKEVDEFRKRF